MIAEVAMAVNASEIGQGAVLVAGADRGEPESLKKRDGRHKSGFASGQKSITPEERKLLSERADRLIPVIAERLRRGESMLQLCKEYSIGPNTIKKRMERLGIDFHWPSRKQKGRFKKGHKPHNKGKKPKRWNPSRLIMAEYNRETRAIAHFDESRHWGNHQAYNTWSSWHRHKKDPERYKTMLEKKYKQIQERERNDIGFKVKRRLRVRLWGFVKRRKYRLESIVGCSSDSLMNWLRRHYKPGMTDDNYGSVWHIDHVIPCAAFNLQDPEQAAKCFNYKNLRPEFAQDNWSKSDVMPDGRRARNIPKQLVLGIA